MAGKKNIITLSEVVTGHEAPWTNPMAQFLKTAIAYIYANHFAMGFTCMFDLDDNFSCMHLNWTHPGPPMGPILKGGNSEVTAAPSIIINNIINYVTP